MYGDIDFEKTAEVIHALDHFGMDEDNKQPVRFNISTPGGDLVNALAIYDAMMELRSKGVEIHTKGVGEVSSAGVCLIAAGSKRVMGPNCRLMIHGLYSTFNGTIAEIEDEIRETKIREKQYIKILKDHSELTEEQYQHFIDSGKNVFISAESALKFGLIDEIL